MERKGTRWSVGVEGWEHKDWSIGRDGVEHSEVLRRAEDAGVQLVSFFWCDNSGIIRGKSTHLAGLAGRLNAGIGITRAMQAMGDMDQLLPLPGMGPAGEVRLIPDPDTFTLLPYAPKRALMLSDLATLDGQAWAACPRDFLKRMLARAAELGLTAQAAMESEWYLTRREGDEYVPVEESLDNSSVGITFVQEVVDDIVAALTAQGIGIEQYHPEVGHGQHEISIRHRDALRAADQYLIYRETVRNVAYRHGLYASFAPKPFPEQAGSGCHIHLSLWDLDGRDNLLFDREGEERLSPLAYGFIGGLLEHLPGLTALCCPSMNSYRRLSPGSWSTAYICYGPDNREAAIRIPSPFWGSEMASTNLEFRPADSSSNPYLALGGLLAAGLDGIARGLRPPAELRVDDDPSRLSDAERESRGIRRLPATLRDAAAALEGDGVLSEAMGPLLRDSYLAVRRYDWELFSGRDTDFELKHHFYKF